MYAIFTEVTVPRGTPVDTAAANLHDNAVPGVRAAGAVAGYWLAPHDGRAVAMMLFDDEAAARTAAAELRVGEGPGSAPDGVVFRSVEVDRVIAHL